MVKTPKPPMTGKLCGKPLGLCSSLVQASDGQGVVSSRLTKIQAEQPYPSPETRLLLEPEDNIVDLAVCTGCLGFGW